VAGRALTLTTNEFFEVTLATPLKNFNKMFQEGIKLKDKSSFKIGGEAKCFSEARTVDELIKSIEEARRFNMPIYVLGGGTNILWSDEGFNGLVLQPAIKILKADGLDITFGAGIYMADLAYFAASKGLSGLEWAGGLPGTLGGAVRGNAGAFGGEMKDVVLEVVSLDIESLKIIKRSASECSFAYRISVFKEKGNREIILQATLRFKSGDKKVVWESIEEKMNFRKTRHPLEYPSAGSVFKNVDVNLFKKDIIKKLEDSIKTDPMPVVPVARLISDIGFKGMSIGGAEISPKHPNFIINTSNATAEDVKKLIIFVKSEVFSKYGVKLEEEIIILP
jgi:UDP-N-acetylmuramate dehydrogenase